eukprot:2023889-Prorocentrum_lima.AAC.1
MPCERCLQEAWQRDVPDNRSSDTDKARARKRNGSPTVKTSAKNTAPTRTGSSNGDEFSDDDEEAVAPNAG